MKHFLILVLALSFGLSIPLAAYAADTAKPKREFDRTDCPNLNGTWMGECKFNGKVMKDQKLNITQQTDSCFGMMVDNTLLRMGGMIQTSDTTERGTLQEVTIANWNKARTGLDRHGTYTFHEDSRFFYFGKFSETMQYSKDKEKEKLVSHHVRTATTLRDGVLTDKQDTRDCQYTKTGVK